MNTKKIAFLGPEGTVSDESARYFFRGTEHERIPYKLIGDVFNATVIGETDLSVIPIENTIDGSVSLHMDLLVNEVNLTILAEWVYPSRQNLIGFPSREGGYAHIRKILSHPVAMAQCRKFLREHLPHAEFEQSSSTAESVRLVKAGGDPSCAAIGTVLAAGKYGLEVLANNIQDHQNNFTRFILVGKEKPELQPSPLTKTSITVTLPEDYPGALHQVLSAFAWRRLNLSRIESRPTKKRLGSYYFFIDIEAGMDTVLLPAAIEEIRAIGCQVRILGSYPSYPYDEAHSEV